MSADKCDKEPFSFTSGSSKSPPPASAQNAQLPFLGDDYIKVNQKFYYYKPTFQKVKIFYRSITIAIVEQSISFFHGG